MRLDFSSSRFGLRGLVSAGALLLRLSVGFERESLLFSVDLADLCGWELEALNWERVVCAFDLLSCAASPSTISPYGISSMFLSRNTNLSSVVFQRTGRMTCCRFATLFTGVGISDGIFAKWHPLIASANLYLSRDSTS